MGADGHREHGAKGLCQERAYVCGLEADALLQRGIVCGTEVQDAAPGDSDPRR